RRAGRHSIEDGLPGPGPADDRNGWQVDQDVMAEAAERRAEQDGDDGECRADFPGGRASPAALDQPDVDHDQEQQALEKRVAVDERGGQRGDRPSAPGQWVSGHGPRRRRLIAPRPSRSKAAPPSGSHGPTGGDFGGWVRAPVMASADRPLAEALAAAAARLVGPGIGVEVGFGAAVAAVAARTVAGAAAAWVAATVGAGVPQTWPKRVAGGGAPNAGV